MTLPSFALIAEFWAAAAGIAKAHLVGELRGELDFPKLNFIIPLIFFDMVRTK